MTEDVIFTVKYPKKPPKEEIRRDVQVIDFGHSARREQRVYCLAHPNKLVMKHYPDRKLWHCESCGYIIQEGYNQSVMKKTKEQTHYRIINDPYNIENISKNSGKAPIGFNMGRKDEVGGLEELNDPINKDSIKYHSATDAAKDTEEPWY